MDGQGNKFELKKQLIEIDKLLNNPQNNVTSTIKVVVSNFGIWHQVRFLKLFHFIKILCFVMKMQLKYELKSLIKMSHLCLFLLISKEHTLFSDSVFLK